MSKVILIDVTAIVVDVMSTYWTAMRRWRNDREVS